MPVCFDRRTVCQYNIADPAGHDCVPACADTALRVDASVKDTQRYIITRRDRAFPVHVNRA